LCNDIAKVDPGRAQYTMALNDRGGVVDDIIVWRFDDDDYWIMPNGVNFDELLERFRQAEGPEVTPVRDRTVLLAVQGPESAPVVSEVIGQMPGRFKVLTADFAGGPLWAAGTGYTGERGAEIAVPADNGPALLEALLAAGATPCGLGARDTLRLEMGYPLWGQDLTEETTPLEARLGWVVDLGHDFRGKEAILRQQQNGVAKTLIGFRTDSRRPPRPGYRLRAGEGTGDVTSGNFSPVLEVGIGMGYVAPVPRDDASVELEVREEWQTVHRATPPFVKR
jgi:aminomethyltransferase